MQTPEQIVADWLEMPITPQMGSELNRLIEAIRAYGDERAADMRERAAQEADMHENVTGRRIAAAIRALR